MSPVSFSINVLYQVGEVPLYSYFKCFSLERVMNCVECFFFFCIYLYDHLAAPSKHWKEIQFPSLFLIIFHCNNLFSFFFPFHTMNYLNLRLILDYLYPQYLVNCIIHRSHSIILCGNGENEVILQRHMKKSKWPRTEGVFPWKGLLMERLWLGVK